MCPINVDWPTSRPLISSSVTRSHWPGPTPAQMAWVATFPLAGFESPGWPRWHTCRGHTHLARSDGQSDAEFAAEAEAAWRADWRFLVTGDRLTSVDPEAPFRGLALPATVVGKLYHHNARRVFPRAWRYDEAKTESTR